MFFHILKKDLKRKKTMNFILLLFIILATMFLASSVNNLLAVNGAIEHYMDIADVADYLTISVVDSENDVIEEYLKDNKFVSDYAVDDTLSVSNDDISIISRQVESEKENYQRTNLLYVQKVPEKYAKVFAMDGNTIELKTGEIAIPKVEAEENDLQVGDKISIELGKTRQEFEVKAVVKDAVFGSLMLGFKRMFISDEDFNRYVERDTLYTRIYNINCKDKENFNKSWGEQNFKVFAPNIDKATVKMCYVMDMLVAGVLIIVSICLILIAFLVLRFTIVFTLQEDYKEIGIMKAIGIKDAGIKGLYMVKYLVISIVGALIGFYLSFPFGDMLLEQAIVNVVVDKAKQNMAVNFICSVAIVLIVLFFCYTSANKLKKYSVIDAIRNGSNGERYKVKNHLKLSKRTKMSPVFYMAVNDILCELKKFIVLGVTFCIGTMLILLPLSALNTLKDDSIVSSFSFAPSDAYIDTGKINHYMEQKTDDVRRLLDQDMEDMEKTLRINGINAKVGADISYTTTYYTDDPKETNSCLTLQAAGPWERHYKILDGKEPVLENEAIITDILAKEIGVSIGDVIYSQYKDRVEDYIITGTYQSMMNMGKGIRVSREAAIDKEYYSGILCFQVDVEDMKSDEVCERIKEIFPEYKVYNTAEFMRTMIGSITDQMEVMMIFIVCIVLVINSLITILMMKTIMTKERGDIALLKSLGFENQAVKRWQIIRILILLTIAVVFGTILSNLSAPYVIGPIFAMMGANRMDLIFNPLEAYVFYPMLLLIATGMSAVLSVGGVKKIDLKEVNNME